MMVLRNFKSNIKTLIQLANTSRTKTLIGNNSYQHNWYSSSDKRVFLSDKYDHFTLENIYSLSKNLSNNILANYNKTSLNGEKIAVLCSNNYTYLVSILAIWMANGVPLGLNKLYPNNLIEYFINDSKCKLVINGINEAEEPTQSQKDLNTLLDKQRVINYKLTENSFYLTNRTTSSITDLEALSGFKRLLNDDKNKEALILYTSKLFAIYLLSLNLVTI
jgi:acyl-CoA synthetase (AMP-forming)/AMP-acid ligase II